MKTLMILLCCLTLICLRVNAQNPDCHPERCHCVNINKYQKTEHCNKIIYQGLIDMDKQSGGNHVRGIELCFPEFSNIDTIIGIKIFSTTNPLVKFKIYHYQANQGVYPGQTQVVIYAQNIESGVPVDDCILIRYRLIATK